MKIRVYHYVPRTCIYPHSTLIITAPICGIIWQAANEIIVELVVFLKLFIGPDR